MNVRCHTSCACGQIMRYVCSWHEKKFTSSCFWCELKRFCKICSIISSDVTHWRRQCFGLVLIYPNGFQLYSMGFCSLSIFLLLSLRFLRFYVIICFMRFYIKQARSYMQRTFVSKQTDCWLPKKETTRTLIIALSPFFFRCCFFIFFFFILIWLWTVSGKPILPSVQF